MIFASVGFVVKPRDYLINIIIKETTQRQNTYILVRTKESKPKDFNDVNPNANPYIIIYHDFQRRSINICVKCLEQLGQFNANV